MFCRFCGEENPENAVYCRNCGTKLKEDFDPQDVNEHTTNNQSSSTTSSLTDDSTSWIGCC